jgi:hypothetical protein
LFYSLFILAGYVDMDPSFNPTSQVSNNLVINDIYSAFMVVKSAATFGIGNIKKALVSGNYFKPTGMLLIVTRYR